MVLAGGRNIAFRALNTSSTRVNSTEFLLGAAGLVWMFGLVMLAVGVFLVFVPAIPNALAYGEATLRIALLVQLLIVPGLTGLASLMAGGIRRTEA